MSHKHFLPVLLIIVLSVPHSGCFYSREISQVRRDIARAYPDAHYKRGLVVSLGPLSLHTIGWIAGLVPEEEAQMASDYLSEIRKVQVGVFDAEYGVSTEGLDISSLRRFQHGNWEVAAKIRDDEELVWVLYREHHDTVRDIFVVVLSEEDMVLARVEGHLNRLLTRVMDDHAEFTSVVRRGL